MGILEVEVMHGRDSDIASIIVLGWGLGDQPDSALQERIVYVLKPKITQP